MSLATIVKGNTFSLAIPLQVYAVEDGEVVLRDYTPESGDNITIRLKGVRRNYTYIPSTNGNIAYIHLEGSEVVGVYAVEVEIVKDDDSKLTSMRFEQLSIVESIDELNEGQITEGIEQGAIYLDPEIFIAGKDGRGIVSITKTATSGLVDTYTITYTDNTTSTFNVTNGKDGVNGQDGHDGVDGQNGVGIANIAKTSTQGLVDTYTITMTNGTTYTYQVTNGKDATQVQSDWSQTDPTQVDYIKNKPTIDNAPTQNSTNLVSSGGVYSAIAPKLAYYELTADTNLAPIWQAYMGGGTISDQQAFNTACEYLLDMMIQKSGTTIFLLGSNSCIKSFYEGYPTTSPLYNPTDSCCVYFEYATEYQGLITYNVVGVERNTTDGVTWGWYSNNSEIELLPAKTFNDYCPIIEDTRSSAVAAITGIAPFSTLVGGQRVIVRLAYNTAGSTTLQLTLSGGTSTNAIPIYVDSYRQTEIQVGVSHFRANDYMAIVYDGTRNVWKCLSQIDTNTTYTGLSQATINAGTEASGRVITAALFHDNAYIVEETYSSGSLKANKMYDFGTVSSALTIPSLDATNDLVSNALNFYALRFIAGADNLNITFPQDVVVDDEPTINTGDYVEIMINKYGSNFYASIKVWQAQSQNS